MRGRLERVDERGYRQWIAMRPPSPVCAEPDPRDRSARFDGPVDLLQTFDGDRPGIRSRLQRLAGHPAILTGKIVERHIGYQRAPLVFEVESVEAAGSVDEAPHGEGGQSDRDRGSPAGGG